MVKVEERPLSTLEKNVLPVAGGSMDCPCAVHHMGCQPLAVLEVFGNHLLGVEGIHLIDGLQELILFLKRTFKAIPEPLFIEQIDHPDAASLRFVGISRTDAPAGGADSALTPLPFHRLIKQAVVRHRDVSCRSELKPRDIDPVVDEHVELTEHHPRINNGA